MHTYFLIYRELKARKTRPLAHLQPRIQHLRFRFAEPELHLQFIRIHGVLLRLRAHPALDRKTHRNPVLIPFPKRLLCLAPSSAIDLVSGDAGPVAERAGQPGDEFMLEAVGKDVGAGGVIGGEDLLLVLE